MQSAFYKEQLKDALENLISVNRSIFDSITPIAMHGELREWNNSVPIGESHQFDFAVFENCDDTNIQLLVKLIEKVDETYHIIKNLNSIQ